MKAIGPHSTEFIKFRELLPTWNFENDGGKRGKVQGEENKLSYELAI